MEYEKTVRGTFLSRLNRFVAQAEIEGRTETVHVKNTGRCRELLVPGADIFLEYHEDAVLKGRKTEYDLIGVYKTQKDGRPPLCVNMDSQAPNRAAEEWIQSGGFARTVGLPPALVHHVRREVTYGKSRFDLAFQVGEQPAFMEVKGVTLERDGKALFPDAPTQRGVKHLLELAEAARCGFAAYVLFVIQMKGVRGFGPNWDTHEAFGEALCRAAGAGVQVLAMDCYVEEKGFYIDKAVKAELRRPAKCATMQSQTRPVQ